MVAWYGQGVITDRSVEHLGASDACVIAYRKMLRDQIQIVQDGGQPMNVFTDPATIHRPELALAPPDVEGETLVSGGRTDSNSLYYRSNFHKVSKGGWLYLDDDVDRYCPDRDTIIELYRRTEEFIDSQRR